MAQEVKYCDAKYHRDKIWVRQILL
jgi:hypothetical protein